MKLMTSSIKSKISKFSMISILSIATLISSCTIEPPLHLADPPRDVTINMPIVQTEMEVIWNVNVDWRTQWWYGWDDEDIAIWGLIDYPKPTYFEVRRFYVGEEPSAKHTLQDGFTIYSNTFRRRYDYGYYDLLVWSNIDSPDGTQVLLINEADIDNVIATTTRSQVAYAREPSKITALKNQPEIFYGGYERDFYISRFQEDYDYFDEAEQAWVKRLNMTLDPLVYIYLVQVVVYNNNGKITGLADNPTMTGMAEYVNVNTGQTSYSTADVVFAMRLKNELPARAGRKADIFGGKFTTFGLCDMPSLRASRTNSQYIGSRKDLPNNVLLNLQFKNSSDGLFTYDVTEQLQRQAHGGVVTIEIDADTITVPNPGTSAGSGFKPSVQTPDSVTHEFGI